MWKTKLRQGSTLMQEKSESLRVAKNVPPVRNCIPVLEVGLLALELYAIQVPGPLPRLSVLNEITTDLRSPFMSFTKIIRKYPW